MKLSRYDELNLTCRNCGAKITIETDYNMKEIQCGGCNKKLSLRGVKKNG